MARKLLMTIAVVMWCGVAGAATINQQNADSYTGKAHSFAQLSLGSVVNQSDGSWGYCYDCQATTVCLPGGSGAIWQRIGSVLKCTDTSVTGAVTDPLDLNRLRGIGSSPTITGFNGIAENTCNPSATPAGSSTYAACPPAPNGYLAAGPCTGAAGQKNIVCTDLGDFALYVNKPSIGIQINSGAVTSLTTPAAPTVKFITAAFRESHAVDASAQVTATHPVLVDKGLTYLADTAIAPMGMELMLVNSGLTPSSVGYVAPSREQYSYIGSDTYQLGPDDYSTGPATVGISYLWDSTSAGATSWTFACRYEDINGAFTARSAVTTVATGPTTLTTGHYAQIDCKTGPAGTVNYVFEINGLFYERNPNAVLQATHQVTTQYIPSWYPLYNDGNPATTPLPAGVNKAPQVNAITAINLATNTITLRDNLISTIDATNAWGAGNDTEALQACSDDMAVNGGAVVLGACPYYGNISMQSGVRVVGQDRGGNSRPFFTTFTFPSTMIFGMTPDTPVIKSRVDTGASSRDYNMAVQNIGMIQCIGGGANDIGILWHFPFYSLIDGVGISNCGEQAFRLEEGISDHIRDVFAIGLKNRTRIAPAGAVEIGGADHTVDGMHEWSADGGAVTVSTAEPEGTISSLDRFNNAAYITASGTKFEGNIVAEYGDTDWVFALGGTGAGVLNGGAQNDRLFGLRADLASSNSFSTDTALGPNVFEGSVATGGSQHCAGCWDAVSHQITFTNQTPSRDTWSNILVQHVGSSMNRFAVNDMSLTTGASPDIYTEVRADDLSALKAFSLQQTFGASMEPSENNFHLIQQVGRYGSTATKFTFSAATSKVVTLPTVANNDYVLIWNAWAVAGGALTCPSGWSTVTGTTVSGTDIRSRACSHKWVTGDPLTVTETWASSSTGAGTALAYHNIDVTNPLDADAVQANNTAGLTATSPSITIPLNSKQDTLLMLYAGTGTQTFYAPSTPTIGTPSAQRETSASSTVSVVAAESILTQDNTTTGNQTIKMSASARSIGVQLALLPQTSTAGAIDVDNASHLLMQNRSVQTYSTLTNGVTGQPVVIFGDGVSVLKNNSGELDDIITGTGSDLTLTANTLYSFTLENHVWYPGK